MYPISHQEADMADLTKEEVTALGHAVGLEIQDPELTEVTYSLNALLAYTTANAQKKDLYLSCQGEVFTKRPSKKIWPIEPS